MREPPKNGITGPVRRLTPAESRVLALLPTHLTLSAIGDRLGSSRATVKTHVAHIYEKLGARTRGEAVEQAEEIGLLTSGPGPNPSGMEAGNGE